MKEKKVFRWLVDEADRFVGGDAMLMCSLDDDDDGIAGCFFCALTFTLAIGKDCWDNGGNIHPKIASVGL